MSRKTIAIVFVLAVAAGVGLAIAFNQRSEPAYNSKPTLSVRTAATDALVAITGTRPVPGNLKQIADITFNFHGIPVEQLINAYEGWAKEKVAPPKGGWPNGLVRATTPNPLTTSEALQLIEDALKQQAHVVIRHLSDGSLSAEMLDAPQSP